MLSKTMRRILTDLASGEWALRWQGPETVRFGQYRMIHARPLPEGEATYTVTWTMRAALQRRGYLDNNLQITEIGRLALTLAEQEGTTHG
jgi:hypothetical protein